MAWSWGSPIPTVEHPPRPPTPPPKPPPLETVLGHPTVSTLGVGGGGELQNCDGRCGGGLPATRRGPAEMLFLWMLSGSTEGSSMLWKPIYRRFPLLLALVWAWRWGCPAWSGPVWRGARFCGCSGWRESGGLGMLPLCDPEEQRRRWGAQGGRSGSSLSPGRFIRRNHATHCSKTSRT